MLLKGAGKNKQATKKCQNFFFKKNFLETLPKNSEALGVVIT